MEAESPPFHVLRRVAFRLSISIWFCLII